MTIAGKPIDETGEASQPPTVTSATPDSDSGSVVGDNYCWDPVPAKRVSMRKDPVPAKRVSMRKARRPYRVSGEPCCPKKKGKQLSSPGFSYPSVSNVGKPKMELYRLQCRDALESLLPQLPLTTYDAALEIIAGDPIYAWLMIVDAKKYYLLRWLEGVTPDAGKAEFTEWRWQFEANS